MKNTAADKGKNTQTSRHEMGVKTNKFGESYRNKFLLQLLPLS
jgi:hypothetical protein